MKQTFTPTLYDAFNPNNGNGARHIDWTVQFEVVQEEVYETISVTATENAEISRIAQVTDRNHDVLNFGSYELNGFPLDGSKVIPPRPTELPNAQVGLVANVLSDASGNFAVSPLITMYPGRVIDLLAVTLDWGYAPAVNFIVYWYRGSSIVDMQQVTGNTERYSVINHAVPNVDRVTVIVTRVQPYHFARLAEFIPGAIINYSQENGDTLTLEENTDPLSERATAGTMSLVANNPAKQFDIFDPTGIYAYFKERMTLHPRISGQAPDGLRRSIDMGIYYLQAPQLKGNLSKIQLDATNILGTLQDTLYTKGIYKTATLSTFVNDVAIDAGVAVSYPQSFSQATWTAYIPSISHAQAFADIARAANTHLQVDNKGVINFVGLKEAATLTIGEDDYRTGDGISPSDDKIFNTVELTFRQFSLEQSKQLAQMDASGTIISAVFYVDNAVITTTNRVYHPKYSPAANLSASIVGGVLTITGQAIISTPGIVTATSRRVGDIAYVYEGKANPFIQAANAQSVCDYMLKRKATKRRIVKVNYRGYPYLDTGDTIAFNSGGSDTQAFFITKSRFNLGGGMTGNLEAREV